ncbi:MAG TPA: response regulator [Lachnospiraceae bacterium]|nr:response regulator [Lachnospiraceae bacterium]
MVEDNEINTLVAMKLLEKVGCIIDTAENGMEAVKKFSTSENGYYDVILMDVRMPILNGIEATKKIRMLDRKDAAIVQIIAMTADAFTNDQDMTQEAGMNAHITNPIEADIMYDTIAQRLIRR